MFFHRHQLWKVGFGLLVLVLFGSLPATASAGWITFTNETGQQIVVQVSVMVNNTDVKGTPNQINVKESASEQLNHQGTKYINVYNPRQPNKPLARIPINYVGKDLSYSIQLDADKKVKLVPVMPPPTTAPKK